MQTLFGIDWYDSGARFQKTDGTFSSLDPMSESYYPISPYAYCAGDPVNKVDPEGEEIWIWEAEESKYLQYKDRALSYSNNNKYEGKNNFVLQVLRFLNDMYDLNDGYISEVLSTLEKSGLKHSIYQDNTNSVSVQKPYDYSLANMGRSVPTFIKLSLSNSPVEGLPTLIIDTVAHELKHAYDYDQGKLKGLIGNPDVPYPNPSEVSVVNFENRIRVRLGLPQRRKYGVSIPSEKLENPWRYKTDKK